VQIEFRARRPSGELRWCVGVAAASFDNAGKIVRLSGVTVDITDRKLAEDRQMLLAEEVDHRARNVVAVVQSIMRLTKADDIPSYMSAVDGRIRALSNAHKLLSRSRWEGADLRKLVDEELEPYRTDEAEKVSIDGPAVLLQPNTAQTLALALHELATNAAKYGALSADDGRVTLGWNVQPGRLELSWVESGAPKITAPEKRGYGTRVVTMGIESQLGGNVKFDWNRDGLRCSMTVPIDAKMVSFRKPPDDARRSEAAGVITPLTPADGNLILLVEDEPLVAMMLADMLSELGHTVDGPHSRLKDAMGSARNGDIQAGILDVNLGGESIYALAEVLSGRGIPFVFITGYSADSIDRRFAHVPVLQKPIEPQKLQAVLALIAKPADLPHESRAASSA
jgi:two-component sensor histidine kinase/CheY-like chemotaxis protein